ncbi:hypothetical protein ILUMI_04839 [Ignelater luminosus]|uniref:Uncharacterized protein n=1 Tax=Ignelater luminosus TaxID=2038154 RepID=A0A8K0GGY7_IGNLU|nr:hypothetical protein ILUMI_04839 [Ignelater luminosus]
MRLHGTDPPDRWRGRPRTCGGLAPVLHSELAQICDKRRVGHGPARLPPSGHQGPHSCEKPGATPGPAHYESGSSRQGERSRSRSPRELLVENGQSPAAQVVSDPPDSRRTGLSKHR